MGFLWSAWWRSESTRFSTPGPLHVVRVTKADPALKAAIKQARDGLSKYIQELGNPKPDAAFAIKGAFQTVEGPEYLWVRSPSYKDGTFSGKLDQQPMALAKQKGDTVTVKEKDVVDWLIKDDKGVQGMFTEKVLQERAGS